MANDEETADAPYGPSDVQQSKSPTDLAETPDGSLDERSMPEFPQYRARARYWLLISFALGIVCIVAFLAGMGIYVDAESKRFMDRSGSDASRAASYALFAFSGFLLLAFPFTWNKFQRVQDDWATTLHRARLGLADAAADHIIDVQDWAGRSVANRRLMEAYDGAARHQAAQAHRRAMNAMVAGMFAMLVGLVTAILVPDSAGKFAAAIVTATGAASASYIARTFIRVRESTANQMAFYFQQPLVESYLLAAERLALQLPDDERNKQYGAIITAALTQAARPASALSGPWATETAVVDEAAGSNSSV